MSIVTLAEAKLYLKMTESTFDVILALMVDRLTSMTQNYCHRVFEWDTFTELYDGGLDYVYIKNSPIGASGTIIFKDTQADSLTGLSNTIPVDLYVVYYSEGRLQLLTSPPAGESFSVSYGVIDKETMVRRTLIGHQNIEITYPGGYSDLSTEAPDLQLAVLMWLGREFRRYNQRIFGSVIVHQRAEIIEKITITGMPPETKEILDTYKRILV